jgi:hypothetical protein
MKMGQLDSWYDYQARDMALEPGICCGAGPIAAVCFASNFRPLSRQMTAELV